MCKTIVIGNSKLCFSYHSAIRAVELGLDSERIRKIIETPDEEWTSRKYGGRNVRDDEYTLGLKKCGRSDHEVVLTVLPASRASWAKALSDGRLGEGREFDRKHFSGR